MLQNPKIMFHYLGKVLYKSDEDCIAELSSTGQISNLDFLIKVLKLQRGDDMMPIAAASSIRFKKSEISNNAQTRRNLK